MQNLKQKVYIGTYTKGDSEGIYVLELNATSGALRIKAAIPEKSNPSFLALHPSGKFLYSVCEVGQPTGFVQAFSVTPSGNLTRINRQSSLGKGPCYVSTDATGSHVFAANYSTGSVVAFPVLQDGSLGKASGFFQHTGRSVHPTRQKAPYAHSIVPSPNHRFAFAADLGLDKILCYSLSEGKLTPNSVWSTNVHPGSGPRHLAFHPNGRFAYVINELSNTIVAFSLENERGLLSELQTVSALPDGYKEVSYCAHIQVHPSGQFLYGSNRGHDSMVVFAIDESSGRLTRTEHTPTQGAWPRHFSLDCSGNILLVANQNSNSIVSFWVDQRTGRLTPTGHSVRIPSPVCIVPAG